MVRYILLCDTHTQRNNAGFIARVGSNKPERYTKNSFIYQDGPQLVHHSGLIAGFWIQQDEILRYKAVKECNQKPENTCTPTAIWRIRAVSSTFSYQSSICFLFTRPFQEDSISSKKSLGIWGKQLICCSISPSSEISSPILFDTHSQSLT